MVRSSNPNKAGKIVAFVNIGAPYEKHIVEAVQAGAIAVVVYRDRGDGPGQAMYWKLIGGDESRLTLPVVEAFERFKNPSALIHRFSSSDEVAVSLWPQINPWKQANDVIAFQVTWNVILSAMQMAIIAIGLLRLRLWYFSAAGLLSIGPVCILLECASSAIRSVTTFVDPFITFKTIPSPVAEILITAPMPFQLASGILLTFYWAETLSNSKVQASPFISEYKKSAMAVIAILFLCEIATSAARAPLAITGFKLVYFSQTLYVLVAAALTISYTICAIQIRNRLAASRVTKRAIRKMTIRFLLSTGGYIMFIVLIILLVPYMTKPWGWKILFNLIFLSSNGTALLQVYSFVPPQSISSKSTKRSQLQYSV